VAIDPRLLRKTIMRLQEANVEESRDWKWKNQIHPLRLPAP